MSFVSRSVSEEEKMRNKIYRSHVTGNSVTKKNNTWYDDKTNERLMSYQVYEFISLFAKL